VTKAKVRKIVREQIAYGLEDELTNGESIMKEAFEQMVSDADLKACYAEMRVIIKWLRGAA
jgi:hypothetical protein